MPLQREHRMRLSRYAILFPPNMDHSDWLLYSTLRGSLLRGSDELVQAIRDNSLDPTERDQLLRLGILVPNELDECSQLRAHFKEMPLRSQRFNYIATLTLDCNLNCPYCYEDHFRAKHYMSATTAALLVQHVVNVPLALGKDINIDFYGGEPLLALPTLRSIAAAVQQAAQQRGKCFTFSLVTNGTLLTPTTVRELQQLGLTGARVTLDGPPDVHNLQRPFVSGTGSFDTIIENISQTANLIAIQLGGNYTRDNFHTFPRLLDQLLAHGISPSKLQLVNFSPVVPKAGESGLGDFSMGCACTNEPWLLEASLYLRHEILARGFNTQRPRFNACAVEIEHDLVINYDGNVYKCPAFMGWPDMRIGSLLEGVNDYRQSHFIGQWDCDDCRDCPYLPHCFGGCRYLQRLRTDSIEGVDCRKDVLDATLEQMLLQDLTLRPGNTTTTD